MRTLTLLSLRYNYILGALLRLPRMHPVLKVEQLFLPLQMCSQYGWLRVPAVLLVDISIRALQRKSMRCAKSIDRCM